MSRGRFVIDSRGGRFAAYGALGWCLEITFTSLHDYVRYRDPSLPARSSLWMFPIYGLLAYLYEPLHDRLREAPWPVRGAAYGAGIMAIEYASGRALRALVGKAPWDYTYAKRHIDGLVRPDYFPYWAAVGLAMERVHDRLTAR
ncbi:MAG TPA: hypothetical protein VG709_02965 [Actinomycetota bacterium]|nr:hypothetical protein [Actinomycetota bacterium]